MTDVFVHDDVRTALAEGRPVVALESTIFSRLGLPAPANREALGRCLAAVRAGGAVPAVTAALDGRLRVGLDAAEHDRILDADTKLAGRDLGVAVAGRWPVGVTTVSGALVLARAAGIHVFATGGIGGVHRGSERTGDVSADLLAIAQHPLVTVCAGPKAFLDLGRTLEYLETAGVTVVGLGTDELPAFYTRTSGCAVPHRVDDPALVARIHRAGSRLPGTTGTLVCVPIPSDAALDRRVVESAVESAISEADARGLEGPAVTPFVLARLAEATGGATIPANLALAENNAAVAAEIAAALCA